MSQMLPGTRALRTFVAAGRHLNFTRAAAEIGLTPAAVSHQIKEIEEQLGIALFTRTSRHIRLTPSGAVLLEAAADALNMLQRGISRARRMARNQAHLRITTSARFATNWLFPRLPRFRADNPTLELSFDITDEMRDFAVDDVDVAIRFGTGSYDHVRSYRLFDTVIAPVCSPKLIENGARLEEPRDLSNYTLFYVDWEAEGMVWPNWRMWMAAAGVDEFDDSRCVGFPDSSHVVQAVIEGGGVGLADLDMIANDLADGRLVRVFDTAIRVAPEYAYHLVYPETSSQDPRVIAFRQWILTEAGREPDL